MTTAPLSVIVPVYNGAATVATTIQALKRQTLPAAELIVVDDGSSDGTAELLTELAGVRVVRLASNQGRACARNAGARVASQPWLLFLDNDRVPADENFIASHQQVLQQGAAGVCGPVDALGSSFWARYQRQGAWTAAGPLPLSAFSSANFSMRRDLFVTLGGFDERYRGYGFEDRDLYARVLDTGAHFMLCPAAQALHTDTLSLAKVWSKLRECGADSAVLFSKDHPGHYRRMRYWYFDARHQRLLRPLGSLLSHLLPPTLNQAQAVLDRESLPYALRRGLAQAYSAAAYLVGTCR